MDLDEADCNVKSLPALEVKLFAVTDVRVGVAVQLGNELLFNCKILFAEPPLVNVV
jgi:hypothetical protein